jgi:hypothetical protein
VAEVSEAGQVADRQATSAVRAMRDSAQKN